MYCDCVCVCARACIMYPAQHRGKFELQLWVRLLVACGLPVGRGVWLHVHRFCFAGSGPDGEAAGYGCNTGRASHSHTGCLFVGKCSDGW
jgi:hypothetical protein